MRRRVLVIDDEVGIHTVFEQALQEESCEVVGVDNGLEAVTVAKDWSPHVIFADVRMPGIDGLETLRRIRHFNRTATTVVITGYPEQKTKDEAFALGSY